MTIAVATSREPDDEAIYKAIKKAMKELGFDEVDTFDSFLFGKTTFFRFDATGNMIKICFEGVE